MALSLQTCSLYGLVSPLPLLRLLLLWLPLLTLMALSLQICFPCGPGPPHTFFASKTISPCERIDISVAFLIKNLPYTIHADMQSRGRRCSGAAMELLSMVRFAPFENLLCQVEFSRTVQPRTDWWEQRCEKWTHWDLNPGPSACEADVIPLLHTMCPV